jgi:hypothetical protein
MKKRNQIFKHDTWWESKEELSKYERREVYHWTLSEEPSIRMYERGNVEDAVRLGQAYAGILLKPKDFKKVCEEVRANTEG